MSHVRSSHQKSRNGCTRCKERHIKCDEQKPECTNCLRRASECQYAAQAIGDAWVNYTKPPKRVRGSSSTPNCNPEASSTHGLRMKADDLLANTRDSAESDLKMDQLELLAQWFTSTAATVVPNEAHMRIQQHLSKDALAQPFVMHGVLALSALHLARGTTGGMSVAFFQKAIRHQNQALSIFRPLIETISASNYQAFLGFSSMTILFAFAASQPLHTTRDTVSLVDDIVEVCSLAKGMHQTLLVVESYVGREEFIQLYGPNCSSDIPSEVTAALESLQQLNESYGHRDPQHDTSTLNQSIRSLKLVYERLFSPNKDFTLVIMWLVLVPNDYLSVLKTGHPLASVILGYYCVALDSFGHIWWLGGWGRHLLREIHDQLDAESRSYLHWPMSTINWQ